MRADPSSNGHGGGGGGTTTPANPALVFTGTTTTHGRAYSALYVMDTDGSHRSAILQSESTQWTFDGAPCWSPSGTSIAFTQNGNGHAPDTLKAIDVSVDNSGAVVASNLRTLYAAPNTNVHLNNPFWCATSSKNAVAFTSWTGGTTSLYTISGTGGTPTEVWTADTAFTHYVHCLGYPTWSPDDSRLALYRINYNNGTYSSTLMIFDMSTLAYTDSIALAGDILGVEWSRSGQDKLVFSFGSSYSATHYVTYCDPTTNATPTSNGVIGTYPTWAPNNSSLMIGLTGTIYKNDAYSSNTSTVVTNVGSSSFTAVKWKR
jgi:hypothetical protein